MAYHLKNHKNWYKYNGSAILKGALYTIGATIASALSFGALLPVYAAGLSAIVFGAGSGLTSGTYYMEERNKMKELRYFVDNGKIGDYIFAKSRHIKRMTLNKKLDNKDYNIKKSGNDTFKFFESDLSQKEEVKISATTLPDYNENKIVYSAKNKKSPKGDWVDEALEYVNNKSRQKESKEQTGNSELEAKIAEMEKNYNNKINQTKIELEDKYTAKISELEKKLREKKDEKPASNEVIDTMNKVISSIQNYDPKLVI